MAVRKRPAAAVDEAGGEEAGVQRPPTLKKPAGWNQWAAGQEEPAEAGVPEVADQSGVTPQQRHVLNSIYPSLPDEVKQAYQEARDDPARGKQAKINALMNAVVPKSLVVSYGSKVQVDSNMVKRFRTFAATHTQGIGSVGKTYTEMIGPGNLGSSQLLEEGLRRNDITKKIVDGVELYFSKRGYDYKEVSDIQGRGVAVKMKTDDAELMSKMLTMAAEEFPDGCCLG